MLRGDFQSGDVVAGNIGLRVQKMEYTAIGDTVNQASRLEGMAKYFGVDFIVVDDVYSKTCDTFRFRRLDRIRELIRRALVSSVKTRAAAWPATSVRMATAAASSRVWRSWRWTRPRSTSATATADWCITSAPRPTPAAWRPRRYRGRLRCAGATCCPWPPATWLGTRSTR
ncbi:MAG: hypothetical protein ING32_02540 [Curvibacter sp.]|nr:hypothetical protein [Curvibacter sp.]